MALPTRHECDSHMSLMSSTHATVSTLLEMRDINLDRRLLPAPLFLHHPVYRANFSWGVDAMPPGTSAYFAQRGDCKMARVALGHHVRSCVGDGIVNFIKPCTYRSWCYLDRQNDLVIRASFLWFGYYEYPLQSYDTCVSANESFPRIMTTNTKEVGHFSRSTG
jgi:hypothetical protein